MSNTERMVRQYSDGKIVPASKLVGGGIVVETADVADPPADLDADAETKQASQPANKAETGRKSK